MRRILSFLFFASCLWLAHPLCAQTYPVQGSAFLIPPYSLRLSDYASSASERLAMNVLLTDVTRAELRVRFRLHLEGPSISVDSKPEYVGTPVTLQGGIPLRLTNLDLSGYFSLQNINFTGISEREFLEKGTLAEGLYRFCFDVLEYNRGVKIAHSVCAQAFLVLNAPPLINLPRAGEIVRAKEPQNVIMQWTPRHTGSPNSAFQTQYEIKVVEVWPPDRNPNDAVLTQPPAFETTVAGTSFVYGPEATRLERGRTYAFRVRAMPSGESEALDLFANGGCSETVSFVYGQTCNPPDVVTGKATGPHTIALEWAGENNHSSYKVHFRKQGSPHWRMQAASIPAMDWKDLEADTKYEYEAASVCGDFESDYGGRGETQTMEVPPALYECGAKPKGKLNTNQEPLPELKAGDVVHTLTVELTITKVTGGNGTFSGEAETRLKIFNNALLSMVFKDIRVNKDYWLIGGYFEAVSAGAKLPKAAEEAAETLGDILNESKGGGTSNDYEPPPPDPDTFVAAEIIVIPDGIQSIVKDEKTGIVTVTDLKGARHDLPAGKDVAVVDENGKGALADKKGQITHTTAAEARAASKREYGFSLAFEKALGDPSGFDKYDEKTQALKNTYETIGEYAVPWKATGAGTATVKGILNFGTAKELTFEQEGARLNYDEFSNILTLNPAAAGSIAQVTVKEKEGDKEKIRGKLNVAGYAPMTKTLHLVPVNNAVCAASEAEIKRYLDEVYGQALVSWQTVTENKLEVPFAGDFDDGKSGLLSTYTADMRRAIKAYGELENDHYYIFLIERGANKTGYMPRGKQAGFVFVNNQSGEELKHVIAHELGHGAFTLRHPFAEYPSMSEKSTDNLMDYNGGSHLYKWQWDQIHNAVLVPGLFEEDEEGEYIGQIVKCLSAEAMDVATNYAFKWVELNFLDNDSKNDFGLTDFSAIWGTLNKAEVFASAGISCVSSVLPPILNLGKNKTKMIAAVTASFGAGAAAMATDIGEQYDNLKGAKTFSEKISQLNWGQALRKAGVQALIAGVSTGVTVYAADHPAFRNFGSKLRNLGYSRVKQILNKTGFSDQTAEEFCRRFGVRKVARGLEIIEKYRVIILDKVKIVAKDEFLPQSIKDSFLDKYYYTGEALENISVYRKFGGSATQAKLFGGFSSTEAVLSRNELAVMKKWSTMQFEVELIVEKGAKLNMGKVAPQSIYSGGAAQVFLPLDYPESWVKGVKDLKKGSTYTLEEFKNIYPDQIK